MPDQDTSNDDPVTNILGSAVLLEETSNYGDFLSWAKENHNVQSIDDILDGYRLLSRSALHVLGYSCRMESGAGEIEKDY